MKVVSNSGPLMALAKLGLLDLLPQLYEEVLVPAAVYAEVVARGTRLGYPDALPVQVATEKKRLTLVEVSDEELPSDLASLPLDAGEKEAIHVALREPVDLVLLDDSKARHEAQTRGLAVRGTLGVIVQAYRSELLTLDEVDTSLGEISARDDIWIADGLCRQVLQALESGDAEA